MCQRVYYAKDNRYFSFCKILKPFWISLNWFRVCTKDNITASLSDEEKLFGITDTSENSQILISQEFLIWEEFANVATNLLEKIEQFFDTVETLQSTNYQSERPKTRDSSTNISFSAW